MLLIIPESLEHTLNRMVKMKANYDNSDNVDQRNKGIFKSKHDHSVNIEPFENNRADGVMWLVKFRVVVLWVCGSKCEVK